MQYSAEQIAQIKEHVRHEPFALSYIEDLEERLGLNLGDEAEGVNGLGDGIALYAEASGEGNAPHVSWGGCVGYDAVTLYTETPEEAKALFKGLLAVKDGSAD